MHVHIGALDAVTAFLYVLLVGFAWRQLAGKLAKSDNKTAQAFGEGMAALY